MSETNYLTPAISNKALINDMDAETLELYADELLDWWNSIEQMPDEQKEEFRLCEDNYRSITGGEELKYHLRNY